MKVIQEKLAVTRLHKKLVSQLEKFTTKKIVVLSGHRGESYMRQVSYSKKLNIWWDIGGILKGKSGGRYWNAFGIGEPIPNKSINIICEINYPEKGINKRIAANWVQDGNNVLLVHSGKIGGGRKGIGKNNFIEYYRGVFEETELEDLPNEITVIGVLKDPNLVYQIKNFVFEVDRIKKLIVDVSTSDSITDPLTIIKHSFTLLSGKCNFFHFS